MLMHLHATPHSKRSTTGLTSSTDSVKNAAGIAAKKLMSYYSDAPGHIISNIPGLLPGPYYWQVYDLSEYTKANRAPGGRQEGCLGV
jgi:hypothetical protein